MIGRTNAGTGGGGGLRVAVGLTAPSSPRENTVWVKSDKAGKQYVFATSEPGSPAEGLIWFRATAAGIITRADVYTGGAWVAADTYMYLGGAWVQIATSWDGTLFDAGNQYEAVTGGWSVDNSYYGGGSIGTSIVGGSGGNLADQGSRIYTNKAILSGSHKTFMFTVTEAAGNNTFYLKSGSISGANVAKHTFNGSEGTFSISIPSGLTSFYPYLQTGDKGKCTITKVWME